MAQNKGKLTNEATRRSKDAATVFNEIMGAPDSAIPKELVDKAQAIAVFPSVLKAAFIFGGTEGKGIISRRIFAQQGNIRGCGSEWHCDHSG